MALRTLLIIAAAGLATAVAGCDNIDSTDNLSVDETRCTGNVAQIMVTDGFLQNLCGCQEAPGTRPVPPAPLTCTVPSGTYVYIHYFGTYLPHQITSIGAPSFPTSPLSDPTEEKPLLVYSFKLVDSGTYTFRDIFDSTLNGTFIVP